MAQKGKVTAQHIRDTESAADAEKVRAIARHLGRALCFTVMVGQHPAGGPREDELIAACDEAWSSLADKVIEFALEDR
jgi:hypothetical protein